MRGSSARYQNVISFSDGPAEACNILPNRATQGFDPPIGSFLGGIRTRQAIDMVTQISRSGQEGSLAVLISTVPRDFLEAT